MRELVCSTPKSYPRCRHPFIYSCVYMNVSAPVVSGRMSLPAAKIETDERAEADPASAAQDLAQARRVLEDLRGSRYRISRVLSAGTDGWSLYIASDRFLRREIVLRLAVVLGADCLAVIRTQVAWARALARVNDTQITRIYDAAVERDTAAGGVGLIVTDFVPGHQLDHCVVNSTAAADQATAASTIAALESSLESLHEQDLTFGVVHPADVVITSAGPVLVALPIGKVSEIGESDLSAVHRALACQCEERAEVMADEKPPNRRTARDPEEVAVTMVAGQSARAVKTGMVNSEDDRGTSAREPQWFDQERSEYAGASGAYQSDRTSGSRPDEDTQERVYSPDDSDEDYYTDDDPNYDSQDDDDDGGNGGNGGRGSGRGGMSEPKRNRFVILLGVLLGLIGLVVVGWFAGLLLGKVAGGANDSTAGSTPPPASATKTSAASSSAPAAGGQPIKIVAATLFDPPPGDGQENPSDLPQAIDGNPGTFWPTLQYNGSAAFGNIKKGVGFFVDLGSEQTVSSVKITTSLPGAKLEIRNATTTTGTSVDGFPIVSPNQTLAADTDFPVTAGTKTRYLLVWLTELVPVQGKFQASISEVTVTS